MTWERVNPPAQKITPETFVLPNGDEQTQIKFISSEVRTSTSSWRCCQCMTMQPPGSTEVWMEDGIMLHDPAWAAREKNQRNRWNGNFSAWCMECATTLLPKKTPSRALSVPAPTTHEKPKRKSDAYIFFRGLVIGVAIATVIITLIKIFI